MKRHLNSHPTRGRNLVIGRQVSQSTVCLNEEFGKVSDIGHVGNLGGRMTRKTSQWSQALLTNLHSEVLSFLSKRRLRLDFYLRKLTQQLWELAMGG